MTLPPTPFTRLVGCRLPLQQAGGGGVTTLPQRCTRGKSVGAVTGVIPAAAVVHELIREVEAVLHRAAVDRGEHGG